MSNVRIVYRGKQATWYQDFWADDAHTVPLLPATGYPKWSVRDPNGMFVADGVGVEIKEGTFQAIWNVPQAALLSNAEQRYEIVWEMLTEQGRTVQPSEQFDVVDEIITEATHRNQKFVCLAGRDFPMVKRFTFKPFEIKAEVVASQFDSVALQTKSFSASEAVQDGDSWFYQFVINKAVLREDTNFIVLWTLKERPNSVPETIYDVLDSVSVRMLQFVPDVRMFIDKYQKKVGRVQAYEDSDIFEYMRRGQEIVNAWHPMTHWGTQANSPIWSIGHLWRLAACWYGLGAQYLLETDLAFSFCVVGETLISTPYGLVKIEDFVGETDVGMYPSQQVITTPTGNKTLESVIVTGTKPVRTIATKMGYEVTGTDNHPVLVITPELNLEWRTLDNIEDGDFIAISKNTVEGENFDLSAYWQQALLEVKSKKYAHNLNVPTKFPQKMTNELGRLLGYVIAEGCFSENTMRVTNKADSLLEDYAYCLANCFGVSDDLWQAKEGIREIRTHSKIIKVFLEKLGYRDAYCNELEIPWSIMQAPLDVVKNFIRTYVDGDGCLPEDDYGIITSSSKKLLIQMQQLLLRFGIISKRTDPPVEKVMAFDSKYECWATGFLKIRGLSWDKYRTVIGEGIKIFSENKTRRYPQIETIPNLRAYVECCTRDVTANKGWINKERVNVGWRLNSVSDIYNTSHHTYAHLSRYLENAGEGLNKYFPELHKKLVTLVGTDFFFDEIVSNVKLSKPRLVYDVRLPHTSDDLLTHAFISNGIVSHNSGQSVTLDYDRTANIDNMQTKLMDLFDKQLTPAKQHLFRRSQPAGIVAGRPYMMGRIYNYTFKLGPNFGGMGSTFFGWLNSLGILGG